MPLSNDFANSRLEYLQSAIKNNDTVTAQFYPRFQRYYNEMYPFTEGSFNTTKIENPQQPVVSSSLKPPSLQMAMDNLKALLIPYIGNEEEANVLIRALTDVQIHYYEEHFNEIQKELLKRIKIPTSLVTYLTNLRMVLASDKHRSNLSIFTEPPDNSFITRTRRKKIKTEEAPLSSNFDNSNVSSRIPVDISPIDLFRNGYFDVRVGNRSDLNPDRIFWTANPLRTRNNVPSTTSPQTRNNVPFTTRRARNNDESSGDGIPRNKKIFRGKGIQSREIKHKKEFHKYAIDLKKLHYNVLALKYLKNANNVATFNPIEISDTLKELLENFLYDEEKIDASDFDKLSHTEKRVLKRLYSFLKIDFNFDHDDQFQKRFEVMYGSFLAGNDNEDLKKELKEYVKLAIHEAIISKQQGTSMMHKLEK